MEAVIYVEYEVSNSNGKSHSRTAWFDVPCDSADIHFYKEHGPSYKLCGLQVSSFRKAWNIRESLKPKLEAEVKKQVASYLGLTFLRVNHMTIRLVQLKLPHDFCPDEWD